jgi:hypothetical membrane protein
VAGTQTEPRPWAVAAIVGIALYVAIDVALAILRPDYSLIRNPESDYGRGPFAWLMEVNFVLRGVLSVLAAIALLRAGTARRWMALLVVIWAVASALLAFFPDNPVGYAVRASGGRHLVLAAIAFTAITVATLAMSFARARANGGLTVAQRVVSIVGVLAFVALLHPLGAFGLVERVFLTCELGWLTLTMISATRSTATR